MVKVRFVAYKTRICHLTPMKFPLISLVAFAAISPLWNNMRVSAPESAYYDPTTRQIFVSNVVGAADKKDGVGWISLLDTSGGMVKEKWVSGLNAPKGLRSYEGKLWVSDIDEVLAFDIATAKEAARVKVPGAVFLNDVAISSNGDVYVSDTIGGKIFVIKRGTAEIFAEGEQLESPNGLLVEGNFLIIAGWGKGVKPDFSSKVVGRLLKMDLKTKKITPITKKPLGNLDGLEKDSSGDYLVSDWKSGKVYRVSSRGKATLWLQGFKGAADLGYIPEQNLMILPRMGDNEISAYRVPSGAL